MLDNTVEYKSVRFDTWDSFILVDLSSSKKSIMVHSQGIIRHPSRVCPDVESDTGRYCSTT